MKRLKLSVSLLRRLPTMTPAETGKGCTAAKACRYVRTSRRQEQDSN
jgi:hypothetical protein